MCDDPRLGISLIFYLQNALTYMRLKNSEEEQKYNTSLILSGLSCDGSVMMPLLKNKEEKDKEIEENVNRSKLIVAARAGDQDALEKLTMDDMDIYSALSEKIYEEDIYSLVDTYIMPYGVEFDHYAVLGEITECKKIKNKISDEDIWKMCLLCNELKIDFCINSEDIYGEPEVGRRFKGVIWLQGFVKYN